MSKIYVVKFYGEGEECTIAVCKTREIAERELEKDCPSEEFRYGYGIESYNLIEE